jgi:uncharacterized Zn finger protein
MREDAATKARRIVAEGRLILTEVTPRRVAATCRGEGHLYVLGWQRGAWHCTCPASDRAAACSHLRALRLVVAVDLEAHR